MQYAEMSLDQLGENANAHYIAGERANQRANDHAKSAGLYLSEAKRRVEETTPYGQRTQAFEVFVKEKCPDIKHGARRAYQLIAHATGKKPLEEVREEKAEGMRRARAVAKAVSFEPRGSKVQATQPTPKFDERSILMERIMAKLAKLSIHQLETVERLIPGSEVVRLAA